MAVYMLLVVVALLVPAADSAKCVFPDEYELGMRKYSNTKDHRAFLLVSNKNACGVDSFILSTYGENNTVITSVRTVMDYNVMFKFVIPEVPHGGVCEWSMLNEDDISRGIPDSAVKVATFPVPLPDDLPKGIKYWRYKWTDNNDVIVGVIDITPSVCAFVVWGHYNSRQELITDSVFTMIGEYSLEIWNKIVFKVPPECMKQTPGVPDILGG